MRRHTHLQRKTTDAAPRLFAPAPDHAAATPLRSSVEEVLRTPGQPLDPATRATLEPQFGHDFSQVRIYADDQAAASADDFHARAYTVGPHIVFGAGQYNPTAPEGHRLLTHELTHVVQQAHGPVPGTPVEPGLQVSDPSDSAEQAATAQDGQATPPAPVGIQPPWGSGYVAWASDPARDANPFSMPPLRVSGDPAWASDPAGMVDPFTSPPPRMVADVDGMIDLSTPPPPRMVADVDGMIDLSTPPPPRMVADVDGMIDLSTPPPPRMVADVDGMIDLSTPPPPRLVVDPIAAPDVVGGAGAAASDPASAALPLDLAVQRMPATPKVWSVQRFAVPGAPPPATDAVAPTAAEDDPAYQAVIANLQTVSTAQQTHDPAEQEVTEAQQAAVMPEAERLGLAQDAKATQLDQTATTHADAASGGSAPGFDKDAFKQAIKATIESLTPSDPRHLEDLEDSDTLEQVRSDVSGQVETGKQTAQGDVGPQVAAPPDPATVPEKPVVPLTPAEVGPTPTTPDTTGAAPKPRGQNELEGPVQAGSTSLDQQLCDAQITEEQLANANEPTFSAALTAKESAQDHASTAPVTYRASEQARIDQTTTEARTEAETGVQAMVDTRTSHFASVDREQEATTRADEAKRQEIGQAINALYAQTKTDVEARLDQLETDVDAAFERGATAARAAFVDYVERETDAYKAARYNQEAAWWDIGSHIAGAVNRVGDAVFGMPEEYYTIYNAGRDLYIAEMDRALDEIASIVATALNAVAQRIATGRQAIADYVAGQPDELRTIAEHAARDIQRQFDDLEQQVRDREQALVDSLAQRYRDNLQALDAEIEAVREANRGLLAQATDLLGGVIETINNLRQLLTSVLARAMDVISAILANPIAFIGNLIEGVSQGLANFGSNILTHLQTGFVEWLTGTLGGAGIQLPERFDLQGIFSLVLQVLGLTYDNVRARAVGMLGEPVVATLETGFEVFVILTQEGLPGVWAWVHDQFTTLKEEVMDGIQEMLIREVIEAGLRWIVGLLGGPAGAFIRACLAIYDVVSWFVANASRLAELVTAVTDSLAAIAAGNVGAMAQAIEQALARAIPVTIGFLASLLGLGDLSQKVRRIIDRLQEPVNRAIDRVLGLVRAFVQKIARMLGFGPDADAADGGIGKTVNFSAGEEAHRLWVQPQGSQASLMVASEPKTVAEQLREWDDQVATLPEAQQDQARGLLSQARSVLTDADQDADFLARMQREVKTLEDGDRIEQRQHELEGDQDELAGVLRQLFELMGDDTSLPEGEVARVPFALAGESHTLSVEHHQGQIDIWMASHREKVQARYQEVQHILKDYRDYLQLTEDEDLKDDIKDVLNLIEAAIASNIPAFVERLTNVRSPARPAILEEVRQHAEALVQEIDDWSGALFPDLNREVVRTILERRVEEEWERTWRAKQQEVNAVLAQFIPQVESLGPGVQMKVRGSLAKGIKFRRGPGGEVLKFDPEDFDIDVYIVSDELVEQAILEGAEVRDVRKSGFEIVGSQSNIPAIMNLVKEMRAVVSTITGVRDTGENAWKFNIYIRSKDNEEYIIKKDTQNVIDAGLDSSRAKPMTIENTQRSNDNDV